MTGRYKKKCLTLIKISWPEPANGARGPPRGGEQGTSKVLKGMSKTSILEHRADGVSKLLEKHY